MAITSATEDQIEADLNIKSPPSSAEAPNRRQTPKLPTVLSFYAFFWSMVFLAALCLPSIEDVSCFGLLSEKHRILENTPAPRIIITGGSNCLFGIDGPAIERADHRKVVNMGLCLMFPVSFLIEEIRDSIKPGDIVVMPLEYSLLSREFESPMVMANILDGYPAAIQWIVKTNCCTFDERAKILIHFRQLGLQKLNYLVSHLRQITQNRCRWSVGKPNPGLEVLSVKNIDSCGDLTWHLSQPFNPNAMERVIKIQAAKGLDQYTINEINSFGDYCKSKRALLVLAPPPIPDLMYKKSKSSIDNLVDQAKQKLSVPYLGNAQRYAFPDNMIFSGHYHLTKDGRAIRTNRLIEDLQPTVEHAQDVK